MRNSVLLQIDLRNFKFNGLQRFHFRRIYCDFNTCLDLIYSVNLVQNGTGHNFVGVMLEARYVDASRLSPAVGKFRIRPQDVGTLKLACYEVRALNLSQTLRILCRVTIC